MKVGMVVVNYNDFTNTEKLLDNIRNYKSLTEIVIVDNASVDDSLKKLKNLKKISIPKLTILEAKENKGYNAGLNIGAKYLVNKYHNINIIFSNTDIIIPGEEVIKELSTSITSQNVVVAPVIEENNTLNRGWKIPSPLREVLLNIPYFHKFFHKKIEYQDIHYKRPYSLVEAVSGCFFMVSSTHLEDINYFDEGVFLYYEENILGVKTKELEKNIMIANNVKVIHNHSKTIDKSIKRLKKYKLQKQSEYYFEKNYNRANIFERILLKLTYYIGYLFYSIYYLIR